MVHLAPEDLISENARESQSDAPEKHFLETIKVEIKKSPKFGLWMFILLDTVSSCLLSWLMFNLSNLVERPV